MDEREKDKQHMTWGDARSGAASTWWAIRVVFCFFVLNDGIRPDNK